MMRIIFTRLRHCALLLACLLVMPVWVHAQITAPMRSVSTVSGKTLVVTQAVTSGASPTSVLDAKISALKLNAVGSYSANIHAKALSGARNLPQLAIRAYPENLSQASLLSAATQHVVPMAASFANLFKAALVNQGVEQGWFSYDQKVFITANGTLKEKHIVFTMSCDTVSHCLWQDPQLVDPNPLIVQVHYTPKNVAHGLPDAWSYPNAGKMVWRLVDAKFVPQTTWATIDVSGAFDEPQQIDGADIDQEIGLKCLIDHTLYAAQGCSSAYIDVATLMNQQGAIAAIVDYTHLLKPVYDTLPDGSLQAKVGMAVNLREVNYNACAKVTYRNTGHYGFTLQNEVSRYWVDSAINYAKLNEFKSTTLSPTQNFDHSIAVTPSQTGQLGDFIINPAMPNGELLAVSTFNNLSYLAPLTYGAPPTSQLASVDTSSFAPKGGELWQIYRLSVTCNTGTQSLAFAITAKKVGGWREMVDHHTSTHLTPNTWVDLNVRGLGAIGGLSAYYNESENKVFVRMPNPVYNKSGWLGFGALDLLINNSWSIEGGITPPPIHSELIKAKPFPYTAYYRHTLRGFDLTSGQTIVNKIRTFKPRTMANHASTIKNQ